MLTMFIKGFIAMFNIAMMKRRKMTIPIMFIRGFIAMVIAMKRGKMTIPTKSLLRGLLCYERGSV